MIYSLRIFLYLLIKIKNKKSILLIPIETVMLSFRFRLSCFTHSSSSHRRLLFLLQPTSPEINVASVWNPLSKIMASFLYPVIIITFNRLSPKTILPFQVPIYVLIMFASSKSCLLHCITYLFFMFSWLDDVFVIFLFGKKKATYVAHMYVYFTWCILGL